MNATPERRSSPDVRIASYRVASTTRAAVVHDAGHLVDIGRAADLLPAELGAFAGTTDVPGMLQAGVDLTALRVLASVDPDRVQPAVLGADEATLAAPIPRPGKIIGVGLNLPGLVGGPVPPVDEMPHQAPFWFSKVNTSIAGPGEPIVHPGKRHTERLIPEPELAMVIGRRCGPGIATPKAEEAPEYIAGWSICNDVSALDIEFERGGAPFAYNLDWSKSYPTFSPVGPWLSVLPAQDVTDLDVRMTVNDRLVCEYSTADMLWSQFELLEFFAATMILEPGDVISCGNAPPVQVIVPGDLVEITIDRVGTLRNPVVAADPETDYTVPAKVSEFAERFRASRQ